MTDEQQTAYESINAALTRIGDAFAQALPAITRAFEAIRAIVADMARALTHIWRQWRAAHIIPRQYRDTMARRKIRHYALAYARRQ